MKNKIADSDTTLDDCFDRWKKQEKYEKTHFWYRQWMKIYRFYWHCIREYNPLEIYRKLSCICQKLYRGYSHRDLWNLDNTFTPFILKRLKAFRAQDLMGHPTDFGDPKIQELPIKGNEKLFDKEFDDGMTKWKETIDKMILAFEIMENDDVHRYINEDEREIDIEYTNSQYKKIQVGLALFAKYYQSLWD